MKSILTMLFSIAATSALAHPSVVAHGHPHGMSALPGVELVLLVMLSVGGVIVLRRLMCKQD